MGKALYRKYRPIKLADVIGQDSVVEPLSRAIKNGQFSHAYLFTGPRGCGKTSVARIFAHEINHFPYKLEDDYPDIVEIDAASNTGVDNIRELREKAIISPTEGKYKVYIIDEVHMLSKSAFNALLKILEEPPAHVVFILATTDLDKVPATILSRAQIFHFQLVDTTIMREHLRRIASAEKIDFADDALALIADRGGGSFRDSISLLDQLAATGALTVEQITATLGLPTPIVVKNLLATTDPAVITEQLKSALNSGLRPMPLAESLIRHILDHPEPEHLPLLSRLLTVSEPFPEAKLLLALLGPAEASLTLSARPVAPSTHLSKRPSVPATPRQSTPSVPQQQAAPPATMQQSPPPPSPQSDFNWDDYQAAISASSPALYSQLQKCQHHFTSGVLHLYPPTPITKKLLEATNNYNTLISHAGSAKITIHSPGEQAPEHIPPTFQDSTFSQLSAIMGNIEEVTGNGEIPFE